MLIIVVLKLPRAVTAILNVTICQKISTKRVFAPAIRSQV